MQRRDTGVVAKAEQGYIKAISRATTWHTAGGPPNHPAVILRRIGGHVSEDGGTKNIDMEQKRSEKWYADRIEYLSGFMMPEREHTLRSVLDMRTRYMTICMENTFHPQNASALVRHCEAFGVQDIHTIETLCKFRPNVNIVKGSDKWVDLHRHQSTTEALAALRSQGYRIVATTPHRGDATPENFDVTAGKFALIFGTEHDGISQEVIDTADDFIRIPMQGFVESLNVSASAAIVIYMLSQRVRRDIPQQEWGIGEQDKVEILFEWMMRTVRESKKILERYIDKTDEI